MPPSDNGSVGSLVASLRSLHQLEAGIRHFALAASVFRRALLKFHGDEAGTPPKGHQPGNPALAPLHGAPPPFLQA